MSRYSRAMQSGGGPSSTQTTRAALRPPSFVRSKRDQCVVTRRWTGAAAGAGAVMVCTSRFFAASVEMGTLADAPKPKFAPLLVKKFVSDATGMLVSYAALMVLMYWLAKSV